MVDFNYYKEMKDLDQFTMIWAHVGEKQQLTFSVELMWFIYFVDYLFIEVIFVL